jgi:hypothetical protein
MSSDDMRYARRSDAGEVVASAERIGGFATVEGIEFIVDLTQRKSW